MMKKSLLIFALLFPSVFALAQSEEMEVKAAINQLFDGMRKGDSAMVSEVFVKEAQMQSVFLDGQSNTQVREGSLEGFLKSIGTPHAQIWDERISFERISIDGPLASVWTPYQFYLGDKFSHCGYNSFQMAKIDGKWKVLYIIDTRRQDDCK